MPTAAKLVAALCFGFLAWVVCIVLEGVMPDNQRVGYLYPVSILLAAICGWFVSGAAARARLAEAAATGMRTAVTAALVVLVAFAVGTMWDTAMRGRYRGPMDAVLDIVHRFLEFGGMMISVPVIATLLIGGAVAGMVTESAGRRWR